MFCRKCGSEITESMKFCRNCGIPVQKEADMLNDVKPSNVSSPTYQVPQNRRVLIDKKPASQTNGNILIIIVCIILSLLFLIGGGVLAYKLMLRNDNDEKDNKIDNQNTSVNLFDNNESNELKNKEEDNANTARKKMEEREDFLNQTISSLSGHNSISVAILDNKAHISYGSIESNTQYSAWGFYLPIYLAYKDSTTSPDENLLSGVMSKDAGMCNQAGNAIIQTLGGTSGVTKIIQDRYNVSATSYGRLFAQTNPRADNYTSAREAIVFLRRMEHANEYRKLSYDLNKFGIIAPYNATVYAQIGTENNAVRKNLNFFAIIKGEKSDYCIAILTKNGAGKDMSALLQTIHSEMERTTE